MGVTDMLAERLARACVLSAGLAVAYPAQAAVIFDNGAPDLVNAFFSDTMADHPFAGNPFQVADDFSFASAHSLTDVHWFGAYAFENTPGLDSFLIRIFPDDGGVPAADPIHEFAVGDGDRTDTGLIVAIAFNLYSYSALLPQTPLDPGTYWLSIVNDLADADDDWYWATSNDNAGNGRNRMADDDPWSPLDAELAFALTGDAAIPEPGTLALVGAALAGLILRQRRARP
jgi:hypothetical protein